jgi:hypothetical protein
VIFVGLQRTGVHILCYKILVYLSFLSHIFSLPLASILPSYFLPSLLSRAPRLCSWPAVMLTSPNRQPPGAIAVYGLMPIPPPEVFLARKQEMGQVCALKWDEKKGVVEDG